MSKDLTVVNQGQTLNVFSNADTFEHAQRIAKALSNSTLVPVAYQNNISNTLVALEMANRSGMSPMMVMQNLDIIQGRPGWNSKYVIAAINACGRFAPLKFKLQELGKKNVPYSYWAGEKNNKRKETSTIEINDMRCVAWTTDSKGEVLEGPAVTIEMAVKEGWYTKNESKWPTMPEVMIRYRAAKFFGNFYVPEVLLGMPTSDEIFDIEYIEVNPTNKNAVNIVNQRVNDTHVVDAQVLEPEPEPEQYESEQSEQAKSNDEELV